MGDKEYSTLELTMEQRAIYVEKRMEELRNRLEEMAAIFVEAGYQVAHSIDAILKGDDGQLLIKLAKELERSERHAKAQKVWDSWQGKYRREKLEAILND